MEIKKLHTQNAQIEVETKVLLSPVKTLSLFTWSSLYIHSIISNSGQRNVLD